jgi:predicted MPP superfamily phosphohydrolase
MNRLVIIILFILFSISAPLLSQQVSASSGAIDDGPYFLKSNDTITAVWIKNNNLYRKIMLPDNFAGIKSMFGFSFDYNDLANTFRESPGFNQRFRRVQSICVISDIHGNFENYITLLKEASVIDGNLRWKFGSGHLVILGDIFDRGEKVTEILWHVFDLEKQALKAGGMVHMVLGNHELMILSGDLRYINEKYIITGKFTGLSYSELFSGSSVLGMWLRSKPVAITINDILFIHAGISAEMIRNNLEVKDINKFFYDGLAGKVLTDSSQNAKLILLIGDNGPLWYRGYFSEKGIEDQVLDKILSFYGVNHIIVGHTPGNEIRSSHQGKIFGIDAGMANGLPGELLLIQNGEFFRVDCCGMKEKLSY